MFHEQSGMICWRASARKWKTPKQIASRTENMFAIDVGDWGFENLVEEYRLKRVQKFRLPATSATT